MLQTARDDVLLLKGNAVCRLCSSSDMHAQARRVAYRMDAPKKSTCMAWVGHLAAWHGGVRCAARLAPSGPEDTVAVVTDRATAILRHVFSRRAGPGGKTQHEARSA